MRMKVLAKKKFNKKIALIVAVLVLACSTGIIYAAVSDNPLEENNAIVSNDSSTQADEVVDNTTSAAITVNAVKTIDKTEKPGQISDELRQKLLADLPHSTRVEISLSDEEKIKLYKEGFSFEEIDAAVMLANDKQEADVASLLKNHEDEVKYFKEKLEKSSVKDKNDMVDEQTMKDCISKGYTRSDVNFAYSASKQLGVTLDDALQSVKSGDSDFANKLKAKIDEVKNNEK